MLRYLASLLLTLVLVSSFPAFAESHESGDCTHSHDLYWGMRYRGHRDVQRMAPAEPYVQEMADELNRIYGIEVSIYQGGVQNAAATTGNRVYYNPQFFRNIGNRDLIFGVLAHEWAHDFCGHIYNGGNAWDKELEADYYSGALMRLTNRDLDRYANLLSDLAGRGSQTHPNGGRRVRALQNGWDKASQGAQALGLRGIVNPPNVAVRPPMMPQVNMPQVAAHTPWQVVGKDADNSIAQRVIDTGNGPMIVLTNQSGGVVTRMEVEKVVYAYGQERRERKQLAFPEGWRPGEQKSIGIAVPNGTDRLTFEVTALRLVP